MLYERCFGFFFCFCENILVHKFHELRFNMFVLIDCKVLPISMKLFFYVWLPSLTRKKLFTIKGLLKYKCTNHLNQFRCSLLVKAVRICNPL